MPRESEQTAMELGQPGTLEALLAKATPPEGSGLKLMILLDAKQNSGPGGGVVSYATVRWMPEELGLLSPHNLPEQSDARPCWTSGGLWGPAAALRDALQQLLRLLP